MIYGRRKRPTQNFPDIGGWSCAGRSTVAADTAKLYPDRPVRDAATLELGWRPVSGLHIAEAVVEIDRLAVAFRFRLT
jgi:hypothetical protein